MTLPKLRIASELHPAPGWIPIVADDGRVAFNTDILMWIAPQPGSQERARLVVDALNNSGVVS